MGLTWADAGWSAAELAALGDYRAAQEAQARADAAGVRGTVLEGQAEVYARWEADTAAERRSAELARSELEARAKTAGRPAARAEAETASAGESAEVPEGRAEVYAQWEADTAADRHAAELAEAELEARAKAPERSARAEAETASAGESGEVPDPVASAPELVERGPAYEFGAGIEDPDAAAEALMADLDQVEVTETEPIMAPPRPEFQARMDALDARAAERAEAQADQAQRQVSREAYMAAEMDSPGTRTPESWVAGPRTPSWGGPEASAPETTPAAEAEAAL